MLSYKVCHRRAIALPSVMVPNRCRLFCVWVYFLVIFQLVPVSCIAKPPHTASGCPKNYSLRSDSLHTHLYGKRRVKAPNILVGIRRSVSRHALGRIATFSGDQIQWHRVVRELWV